MLFLKNCEEGYTYVGTSITKKVLITQFLWKGVPIEMHLFQYTENRAYGFRPVQYLVLTYKKSYLLHT